MAGRRSGFLLKWSLFRGYSFVFRGVYMSPDSGSLALPDGMVRPLPVLGHTPRKINMEPENTPPGSSEHHLPSPIIFRVHPLNLPGVYYRMYIGKKSDPPNNPSTSTSPGQLGGSGEVPSLAATPNKLLLVGWLVLVHRFWWVGNPQEFWVILGG